MVRLLAIVALATLLADPNPITSGPHKDEGPPDRYQTPYVPIVYGHTLRVPLPDFTWAHEAVDWDGDGLVDLLALEKRGGGLKVYRNIGTPQQPTFQEPRHATRIMDPAEFGGFNDFVVADLGTGRAIVVETDVGLTALHPVGDPLAPSWRAVPLPDASTGDPYDIRGGFTLGDLTGDGKPDLVFADFDDADTTDLPKLDRKRLMHFPDPTRVDPSVGKVWLAENVAIDPDQPTFAEPREIVDGVYLRGRPAVIDLDGDGRNELVLTTDDARIRAYRRDAVGDFVEAGERDAPLNQDMRVRPADFGNGVELLAAGWEDEHGPFVRLAPPADRDKNNLLAGWQPVGTLGLDAKPDTPVTGVWICTVDVVDLDRDGADDLLLGAEPGVPMLVRNLGTNDTPIYAPPTRLRFADGSPLQTFSLRESPTVGSFWGPTEWHSDRLAPRAVDWDGDGVLDLISGSMGRRLYLFCGTLVDGELRFRRPEKFRRAGEQLDLPDRLFPGVHDWNDDGHPDLIFSNDAGHVLVYPGTGTLDLADPTRLGDIVLTDYWNREKGNRSGFAVHDWTGDGRPDLIAFQFHRGVFLFQQNPDGSFGPEQLLVPLYTHLAGPTVYDYDRDGVVDLVIGGDERRMIEPANPAHIAVFRGQDLPVPPRP